MTDSKTLEEFHKKYELTISITNITLLRELIKLQIDYIVNSIDQSAPREHFERPYVDLDKMISQLRMLQDTWRNSTSGLFSQKDLT